MKRLCDVAWCDNQISEQTGTKGGLPICKSCAQVRYYWRRNGADALSAYKERLRFRASRVEYLEPYVARIIKRAKQRVARARAQVRHGSTSTSQRN